MCVCLYMHIHVLYIVNIYAHTHNTMSHHTLYLCIHNTLHSCIHTTFNTHPPRLPPPQPPNSSSTPLLPTAPPAYV